MQHRLMPGQKIWGVDDDGKTWGHDQDLLRLLLGLCLDTIAIVSPQYRLTLMPNPLGPPLVRDACLLPHKAHRMVVHHEL